MCWEHWWYAAKHLLQIPGKILNISTQQLKYLPYRIYRITYLPSAWKVCFLGSFRYQPDMQHDYYMYVISYYTFHVFPRFGYVSQGMTDGAHFLLKNSIVPGFQSWKLIAAQQTAHLSIPKDICNSVRVPSFYSNDGWIHELFKFIREAAWTAFALKAHSSRESGKQMTWFFLFDVACTRDFYSKTNKAGHEYLITPLN